MTSIPPGWYPDPSTPSALRYWDGASWTAHRQPAMTPALRAPAGTDWNTAWIWLVTLLPVLPTLLLLFVPWGSMFGFDPYTADPSAFIESQLALYTSPALWATQLLGYAVYGFGAYFAYRDQRELLSRGVPKPFPWGWAFLNPVYPIGRSVVVKRRTGRGAAPMWAAIGVAVLSIGVSIVISVMLFAGMADMMQELVSSSTP